MIDSLPGLSLGLTIASRGFLLVFLPATLLIYWLACRSSRSRRLLLLAASLLFYLLAAPTYLTLLVALSLATWWLARTRRTALGVALNVAVLFCAKILAAGIADFTGLANAFGGLTETSFILPLGLSFYTFKHISYLIDVRQERHVPSTQFSAFLTYSAFFPQITAGPLSGFTETSGQMRALPRRLERADLGAGLVYISFGLAKKALIADTLTAGVSEIFHGPGSSFATTGMAASWLALIALTLGLYFDFSGYTDIVLGTGRLFGIRLPANFNSPFLATDPRQFWERWHMSLVTWFRSYVFLATSRTLLRRWGGGRRVAIQEIATMMTMVLLGAWHGLTTGWLLWGTYNGLLLVGHSWTRRHGLRLRSPIVARSLLIISVVVGMAIFSSPNPAFLRDLLVALCGGHGLGIDEALHLVAPEVGITLLVAAVVALSGVSEAASLPVIRHPAFALALGVLAALCLMNLGVGIEVAYARF